MSNNSNACGDGAVVYCGWGRVLFAHTFDDPAAIARKMQKERPGERDIAAYVTDPQVVLSYAPQQLFLDPSDTLRLDLGDPGDKPQCEGISIRRVRTKEEARAINDLYLKRNMVPSDADFIWQQRRSKEKIFLVAVDTDTGEVAGTVTGLDHTAIFDDPTNGSSLWCLAVDPAAVLPGIGEALVRHLSRHFRRIGRSHMDLSVIHDNRQAKALYRKLGFEPVQYFAIKIKNAHNEALFLGPELEQKLNPYARIIVDEARSRGISVKVLDIERQSRRRRAATGGESEIPIDGETRSCLAEQDYTLKDVIPSGESVVVRKTANLHTGGTLHDVTDCLHPSLIDVSRQIAQRLEIPVVGLDFIVTAAEKREYVIIEANERPGLANHEPQPTAQRFVDLLFPLSISAAEREPRSTQSE